MRYLEIKQVTRLVCSHPKVRAVWETGSMEAMNPVVIYHNIHLILDSGERKDFTDKDYEKVKEKTEYYLSTL